MPVTPAQIERSIFALLDERAADATICPSEVARRLVPDAWRDLMPQVRAVAMTLARRGALRISQKGRPVDADSPPRGPIRLGRKAG